MAEAEGKKRNLSEAILRNDFEKLLHKAVNTSVNSLKKSKKPEKAKSQTSSR